jgi:hypothetical protein
LVDYVSHLLVKMRIAARWNDVPDPEGSEAEREYEQKHERGERLHRLRSPPMNLLPRIPLARMCGFDEWLSFSASCFFDTPRAAAALVIAPGCRTAFLIQFFPMTLLSRQSPRQSPHVVTEGDELLARISHNRPCILFGTGPPLDRSDRTATGAPSLENCASTTNSRSLCGSMVSLTLLFLFGWQVFLRSSSEVVELLMRHIQQPTIRFVQLFRRVFGDCHRAPLVDGESGHRLS